jgi:magnesium-transporting ATPase (P-type)
MRFLKRLLFLHGRWSLQRTSYFINNFLWKNFLIFVGQIFFAIYSDYSAQTFYSDGNLLVYNSGVNSVIPFYYAAFEVDLDPNDPRFTEHLPALYKEQRKRDLFSIKKFLQWTITAIFLAAAFFFSTLFTFGYATLKDAGQTTDIWAFSQCNYL